MPECLPSGEPRAECGDRSAESREPRVGLVEILMIAVGLAMDAFAVSLGAGTSGQAAGGRAAFRLSFHFGLFQFMMPVMGWYAGIRVAPVIASVDD